MWVEVILPLSVEGTFTYSIPAHLQSEIQVGKRVIVPFGAKRKYAGMILTVYRQEAPSTGYPIKNIESIIDKFPIVSETQLQFWKWMADYYMCTLGDVMNAALPAALKLESETFYKLHPNWEKHLPLSPLENKIVQYLLQHEKIHEEDLPEVIGKKTIRPLLKSLIEREILLPQEEIEEKYKPLKVKIVRIHPFFEEEKVLQQVLDKLEKKSPKQYEALLWLIDQMQKSSLVPWNDFLAVAGSAAHALKKKEIILVEEKFLERYDVMTSGTSIPKITFTDEQQAAIKAIDEAFRAGKNVLLFGVTGSGKTLVYVHYIREVLTSGGQVLFLLPEISLTQFMVERIKHWIPDYPVLVYHSQFSPRERVEVWKNVLRGEPLVVLGARSALFLPYPSLKFIVVDEEHDSSYKQNETPRYHARDVSLMLAKIIGAKVILGSATPSLDSYHLAKTGKLALVKLNEKFGDAAAAEVKIVNMRPHIAKREMRGSLTPALYDAIKLTLHRKKQVILFQNRRGYSTWVECSDCGWSPMCTQCDANLIYHKDIHLLTCHHCGFTMKVPAFCPECGSSSILMRGVGTQRIEDELSVLFPEARIARLDHDTARQLKRLYAIFDEFENRQIDILVGTQMITKGLDFTHVELVGILNADLLYPYPEFRSHEQALQLMLQVAGRAGRRNEPGKVIVQIQTSRSPLIRYLGPHGYEDFMFDEILFRQKFSYPPFTRLIKLQFIHKDEAIAHEASSWFVQQTKEKTKLTLLGPDRAPIARIKNKYIFQVLIKLPRDNQLFENKKKIHNVLDLLKIHFPSTLHIVLDVDPL